jgi:adenosylhomocysteine nucleosidase
MKKILTVFALEEETQNLFANTNIIYTGVGKVNASYSLTKAILQNRPDVIINLGTAGSKNFNYGEMVLCERFIQRDMNATVFGYENFVTPSDSTPQVLEIPSPVSQLFQNKGTCGTGDSFETKITGNELYNVVDMEGFALAKVAFLENIPFICVKFVSDGANEKAPSIWSEALQIGARKMRESYNLIVENLQ